MNFDSHLCTTIQSGGNDVVVLIKPAGMASSQPPLRKEGNTELRQDRRIDAHAKPANVVAAVNASIVLRGQYRMYVSHQMTGVYK